MHAPRGVGVGKVVALMRTAALAASEGAARDAFGDQPHVPQIMQIQPLGIEARGRRRQVFAGGSESAQVPERALEAGARAQRTYVLAHYRLKARDFRGWIDVRPARH